MIPSRNLLKEAAKKTTGAAGGRNCREIAHSTETLARVWAGRKCVRPVAKTAPSNPRARCWQTNANWSLFAQTRRALARAEAAPLSESGGTVKLEKGPGGEGAFLVEVVVDRGVDGSELL